LTGGRITLQPWMRTPEARAVMKTLLDGGATARFVGGCVRDTLFGRPIKDIDIATDAEPKRVMALMRDAGFKVVPTGIEHGTVTAVIGGTSFEITTLRHDVETDGRHATVAFTDNWEADAARRDLTINALSLEIDGTLHDPFGGQADLMAGRVRFVGDPVQRISEDVLRLLRFFRFLAHFGTAPPDADALAACRAMAPAVARLSAERVRVEVMKLLQAPNPVPTLELMRDATVLEYFLPEARNFDVLARLIRIETEILPIPIDPVRRLAALLQADTGKMSEIAQRLKLSNAERAYLVMSVRDAVSPALDPMSCRRLLYRAGAAEFREQTLLSWARSGDMADDGWLALVKVADGWSPVTFPLSGTDVLERGLPRGPAVGDVLTAVEDWWIDGDFRADRPACLARLDVELAARG